jgi:hypothetical protein
MSREQVDSSNELGLWGQRRASVPKQVRFCSRPLTNVLVVVLPLVPTRSSSNNTFTLHLDKAARLFRQSVWCCLHERSLFLRNERVVP